MRDLVARVLACGLVAATLANSVGCLPEEGIAMNMRGAALRSRDPQRAGVFNMMADQLESSVQHQRNLEVARAYGRAAAGQNQQAQIRRPLLVLVSKTKMSADGRPYYAAEVEKYIWKVGEPIYQGCYNFNNFTIKGRLLICDKADPEAAAINTEVLCEPGGGAIRTPVQIWIPGLYKVGWYFDGITSAETTIQVVP